MERLLLRPDEVQKVLNISRSQVYKMLQSGEIPSLRIGRVFRIPDDKLKAWIERRSTEGSSTISPPIEPF
jgi:excisionase family DNA binding protein